MKIKVIKSSSPYFWYSNHIGEILTVLNVEEDNEAVVSYTDIYDGHFAQGGVIDGDYIEVDELTLLRQEIELLKQQVKELQNRPLYIPYVPYSPSGGSGDNPNPYPLTITCCYGKQEVK